MGSSVAAEAVLGLLSVVRKPIVGVQELALRVVRDWAAGLRGTGETVSSRRIVRWVALLVLVGVATLASGCTSGPAEIANKFVSATFAEEFVEANGYLSSNTFAGGSSDTSGLVPGSAKPDFQVTEQGDTAARVVSASDERMWMLLEKVEGNWRITEIGYVEESEVTEPIPYETEYTDDDQLWEGTEEVVQAGENGLLLIHQELLFVNGQQVSATETQQEVQEESANALVRRGTKPRSTGAWIDITDGVSFTVTRVATVSNGIAVEYKIRNSTSYTFGNWGMYLDPSEVRSRDGVTATSATGSQIHGGESFVGTCTFQEVSFDTSKMWFSIGGKHSGPDTPSWSWGDGVYGAAPMSTFWVGPFYQDK